MSRQCEALARIGERRTEPYRCRQEGRYRLASGHWVCRHHMHLHVFYNEDGMTTQQRTMQSVRAAAVLED